MLLLDEPLGALDLKLRENMQEELKALQKALGITFVFVTHDQGEALSMADRVAVFNDGRIMQVGTPEDIYQRPRLALRRRFRRLLQRAAARFRRAPWRPARAGRSLRPEAIRIVDGDGRRGLPRTVVSRSYLGAHDARSALDVEGQRHQRDRCRPAMPLPAEGEPMLHRLRRERPASDGRRAMSMAGAALPPAASGAILPDRGGLLGALSDIFWRKPKLLLFLMLAPPVLWLGIVYLGSLFALLLQSFFSIDEFSGLINREFTLKTYGELLQPANLDIIVRTVDDGGAGHGRLGRHRLSRSPTTRPAMRAANGRRCSISASCCRCGRAIWSRSMPGS